MSVMGRGSKGAGYSSRSGIALPSDLDNSSVLPLYTHSWRHLSLCIFLSPELRCQGRERQGQGLCSTAPGSLRQTPPSTQQHFSSKPGKTWHGSTKKKTEGQQVWHFRNPAQSNQTMFCLFCKQLLSQISLLGAAPTETVVNNKEKGKN